MRPIGRAPMQNGMSDPADTQRLIGDMIRLGEIASVDFSNPVDPLVTVTIGDLTTAPLPIIVPRCGRVVVWSPPSVGEQVCVLCPEGDTEAGLVIGGLFSAASPAPSNSPDLTLIQFGDGAKLSYDMAAHHLAMMLPDGATAELVASGGLTITGNVALKGDLSVDGAVAATGDVTGQGTSLHGHIHSAVKAGTDKSGAPV